jgi:hypothetical protein
VESNWMNVEDVATYLGKSVTAARGWMFRNKVKRSPSDRTLTCKEWVDAALYGNNLPAGQATHGQSQPQPGRQHGTRPRKASASHRTCD